LTRTPLRITDNEGDSVRSFGGATATMQSYLFDDRNITWQTVEVIGAQIYVLAVDDALGVSDVLIRFQPNTPGKLHRHLCDFSTFVLQGELRFWRPDGSLKEIRPTGSYVQVAANGEPHSEGAGDQMAIVLFSFRGTTADMILYLGDGFRLGFTDFKAVLDYQIATGAARKLNGRDG
jgi:quercetin dioxygenase-like cupin family protein